ncbi:MAG: methyltransferase domain-containing protein [Thermoanaerobaculales bacterium]|nr:methyltransferase domain-containing protein [Thermoanaerobaculales bacterium]
MAGRPRGEELQRLRAHFEIERELADRLRNAGRDRRKTLYREVYDELFERVELVGNAEAQQSQVGLLLELLGPFLDGVSSFLEVGAGACELSLELAPRVDRVWAVDAVDPGIESPPQGFTFVPSHRLASVVPASSVDLALSCHTIEHLHPDDLRDHLWEVRNALAPGGAYVIVTPNRLYGPHDISRYFSDVPLGFHLREYTHTELAAELTAAGFARVRLIGGVGEAPKPGTAWKVRIAEAVLDVLPAGWRRRLLNRAPRSAPFRPLEQVKLVGTR